jgi:SAM-dependent methyltransferase
MDARYWEKVGDDYESSIFDSQKMDKRGVVAARVREYANPRATACDFGCGVGHYLPLLSPHFRRIYGLDFADSLLRQAAARCKGLDNVDLTRADLSKPRAALLIPKVRFGVCANVLISADEAFRQNILRTIRRHLVIGGHVLFVVPSLESALFSNARLIEWNKRLGHTANEAFEGGIPPTARSARELLQGLVRIEEVPTKHYLREEFEVLLTSSGFRVTSIEKVEYGWDSEFEQPPRWMKPPGPWDWLVVARRLRA